MYKRKRNEQGEMFIMKMCIKRDVHENCTKLINVDSWHLIQL